MFIVAGITLVDVSDRKSYTDWSSDLLVVEDAKKSIQITKMFISRSKLKNWFEII